MKQGEGSMPLAGSADGGGHRATAGRCPCKRQQVGERGRGKGNGWMQQEGLVIHCLPMQTAAIHSSAGTSCLPHLKCVPCRCYVVLCDIAMSRTHLWMSPAASATCSVCRSMTG